MKLRRFILVIAITILIGYAIGLLIYNYYYIVEIKKYPMVMTAGGRIGINTGRDPINFGIVPLRGSGKRFIDISHDFDIPVIVSISATGQLGRYVTPTENNFILLNNETIQIGITAVPPHNAVLGQNYTGTLIVVFKRARFI